MAVRVGSWSEVKGKVMGEEDFQSPRGENVATIFSMTLKSPKIMRRIQLLRVTD